MATPKTWLFARQIVLLPLIFLFTCTLFSQQEYSLQLDVDQIAKKLEQAPLPGGRTAPVVLELPTPQGEMIAFVITESPVVSDKVAQRLQIRTYSVQSQDGSGRIGRISYSPGGIYGVFRAGDKFYFLDVVDAAKRQYRVFYDHKSSAVNYCSLEQIEKAITPATEKQLIPGPPLVQQNQMTFGTNLRTYRMVVVGTEEYTAGFASQAAAETNLVNMVNTFNLIFQPEMAISLNLVDYTALTTDNYDAGNGDSDLAGTIIADVYPNTADYDIGHVFHNTGGSGGSGEAGLGVVCAAGKGKGWSSGGSPLATNFGFISLAAHEIGHQFGANHTFDSTAGSCVQRAADSSFEPMGGATIMAYFGVCGSSDISDPELSVFHVHSLEQMNRYVSTGGGNVCVVSANSNNNPPIAYANPSASTARTIPQRTPFRLTGAGTDPDGDQITYSWEQHDLSDTPPPATDVTPRAGDPTAPLFRSYFPSSSPTRTFPNQASLLVSNYLNKDEALPTVGRNMEFRLTVRDNQVNGGGVHWDSVTVIVDNDANPFEVTSPNGGESLVAGNITTITWDAANTGVYCNNVDIRLSYDGGYTFPIVLLAGASNDGSQQITIPANVPNTTQARIEIACANDSPVVFFDISDEDFTITSACLADGGLICPADPMSLPAGDPGLDLTLNNFFGTPLTVRSVSVGPNDPNADNMAVSDGSGNAGCNVVENFVRYKDLILSVDKTGQYGLNLGELNYMTLFDNATYDAGNPCNSFLGSTIGPGLSVNTRIGTILATLEQCKTYRLRIYYEGDYTLTVFGQSGGQVYLLGNPPGAGYSYTYTAVNRINQQIMALDAGANFTGLNGGSYFIYGLSYANSVNLNTLIGQTVNQVNGVQCVSFSKNRKDLTVTGGGGCNLSNSGLANLQCNNNNTNADASDDYLTFTLQPNNPVGEYNVTVSSGTVTKANGDPASNIPYGVATAFRLQNGSAGAGNVTITITDTGSALCTVNASVIDPGSCSAGGGDCNANVYTSTDVNNKIISFTQIMTSEIQVPTGGTIQDVNVLNLNGQHTWINDLIVKLKSPVGTEITLFGAICNDEDGFNLNLDDEAATTINICPPTGGGTFQPAEALSAFDNEDQAGTWILTIEDVFDEDDGLLLGWQLEICSTGGGGDCPENLPVNGTILADTYQAKNIESTGTVGAGITVNFLAEQSIKLQPGFHTAGGSLFNAQIAPCPAPAALQTEDVEMAALALQPEQMDLMLKEPQGIDLSVRPNPFKNRTIIDYRLEEPGAVTLEVYSLTGGQLASLLREEIHSAGEYQVAYYPTELQSGIYLLVMQVGSQRVTRKLVHID